MWEWEGLDCFCRFSFSFFFLFSFDFLTCVVGDTQRLLFFAIAFFRGQRPLAGRFGSLCEA